MSYLARLKQLDQGKNFSQPPGIDPPELTEPGCVSSGGSISPLYKIIHGANDDRDTCFEQVVTIILHRPLQIDGAFCRSHALPAVPDCDDRRFCTQCRSLQERVCSIAGPGMLVSARQGYQPRLDVPHRCAGYAVL